MCSKIHGIDFLFWPPFSKWPKSLHKNWQCLADVGFLGGGGEKKGGKREGKKQNNNIMN